MAAVVLDEFHERHLEGDLALALLRRLQRTERPDLRLVVMSATLDAAPVAQYLGGARVMRSEGRQYPLEIEYTPHSAAPLEEQVAAALERLAARGLAGHVLVFLPGAAEIRRAQTACAPLGPPSRLAAVALARRSIARRAGPRGGAVGAAESHPLHQRGGKLHHH